MKSLTVIALSCLLILPWGCKKNTIELYNTQNTPDLTNPIIQKLSNVVWYRDVASTRESWASQENVYKPSDYASSLLYQAAWFTLALYRDGTSNMIFLPPFVPSTAIHCKGNWQVSTEEENTVILRTKTPVSSVLAKIKVLDMQIKDEFSFVRISMDMGSRLLETKLVTPPQDITRSPAYLSSMDYGWFETRQAQTAALDARDFIGAWSSPYYLGDGSSMANEDFPLEGVLRITYVEDLLAGTPAFVSGVVFNLLPDGKAQIGWRTMMSDYYKNKLNTTKEIVSDARWSVSGNKLMIETDEEYFSSVGEELFNIPPYVPELIYVSEDPRADDFTNLPPVRILPGQFFCLEVIERTDKGFWARITTKTAIFYAFMSKTEFDGDNTINIREAHQN